MGDSQLFLYMNGIVCEGGMCTYTPRSENNNLKINKEVSERYDNLMAEGKHGHYETLFRIVHEHGVKAYNSAIDRAIEEINNRKSGFEKSRSITGISDDAAHHYIAALENATIMLRGLKKEDK